MRETTGERARDNAKFQACIFNSYNTHMSMLEVRFWSLSLSSHGPIVLGADTDLKIERVNKAGDRSIDADEEQTMAERM